MLEMQAKFAEMQTNMQALLNENAHMKSESVNYAASVKADMAASEAKMMHRSLDLGKNVKPKTFSGVDSEFSDWDFTVRCHVASVSSEMGKDMERVGQSCTKVVPLQNDPLELERSRTLFSMIALLTEKHARKIVRATPDMNGLEAYRRLVERFGGRDEQGETSMLIRVMNFDFGTIDEMEGKFEEFNLLVKDHDDVAGVDEIGDQIKKAVIVARSPEPLRTHLQLNSGIYTSWSSLSVAITQFLKARKGIGSAQRGKGPKAQPENPDAMDCDWVGKGKKGKNGKGKKGKGKGKGDKGKDKGSGKEGKGDKPQSKYFEGECSNCGRWGHKRQDCWRDGGGAWKQQKGANVVEDASKETAAGTANAIDQVTSGESDADDDYNWVLCIERDVAPVDSDLSTKLWVDSGCFDHCCPFEFANHFALEKEGRMKANTASNTPLIHYGRRVVHGWMEDTNQKWIPVSVKFHVFNVKKPLLATSKLVEVGFTTVLGKSSRLERGGRSVKIDEHNQVPFVRFWIADRPHENMVAPISAEVEEVGDEIFFEPGEPEAQRPKAVPIPKAPSKQEREEHEVTHLPYRAWCEFCTRSRARESPHYKASAETKAKRHGGIPVVEADYAFVHDAGDKHNKITLITMVDCNSGAVLTTVATKKGTDPFVERSILKSLENWGRTGDLVIQTDKEYGPIEVVRKIASKREGKTIIRQTPKKSKQSNAIVERMHQTVEGLMRTHKEVIEVKTGYKVHANAALTSWIVRHAGFLQTRYAKGTDGKTAWERLHGRRYESALLPFGAAVEAKVQDTELERSKFDMRLVSGVWLGRTIESDEHIVGNENGIILTRTVRPKNDEQLWQKDMLAAVGATPWAPRAGPEPQTVEPLPGQMPMKGGLMADKSRKLQDFWQEKGKTAGCQACVSPAQRHHTAACKKRQAEFERERSARYLRGEVTTPAEVEPQGDGQPAEAQAQTGTGDSTQQQKARQAEHRDLDERPLEEDRQTKKANVGETPAQKKNNQEAIEGGSSGSGDIDTPMTPAHRGTIRTELSPALGETPTAEPPVKKKLADDPEGMIMVVSREWVNEDPYGLELIRGLPAALVTKGQAREMEDLLKMKVFKWIKEEDVPIGADILDCGWAMRLKSPIEVRARVVLKDFAHTRRDDVYAPTPTSMTIRILLLYAALLKLQVSTADVRVAFMHATASVAKYARPPSEQRVPGWLWLIEKAMNGMRTGARDWCDLVCEIIVDKMGWTRGTADPQLYIDPKSAARMVVHTDDPILAARSEDTARIWAEVGQHVLLKEGITINKDSDTKYLSRCYRTVEQEGRRGFKVRLGKDYFDSITEVAGMTGCKSKQVPGHAPELKAGNIEDPSVPLDEANHRRYRGVVGKMQYMTNEVPEIAFAVKGLSRRLAGPTVEDEKDMRETVRYTAGVVDEWLYLTVPDEDYDGKPLKIEVYTDADWAGDTKTLKSTSSSFVRVKGFLLGANVQLQDTHAQSSGESEFYAMGAGCCDGLYAKALLAEFGLKSTIKLKCDATAGKAIAQRMGLSKKTRHVKVKHLFIQELVKAREIEVSKVDTEWNIADMGTKHLKRARFEMLKQLVGKGTLPTTFETDICMIEATPDSNGPESDDFFDVDASATESDARGRDAPDSAARMTAAEATAVVTAARINADMEAARPTFMPSGDADRNMLFTVDELKTHLRERGLYVSGIKRELAGRLARYESRAARTPTSWEDVVRLRAMVIQGIDVPGEAFVYEDVAMCALTLTLRNSAACAARRIR